MHTPADQSPGSGPPRLTRSADLTLSEQLASRFAERIVQHLLPPGARLPSVRDCARRHGVSPSTVVSAYDQLLARGLVEARPQRGFFVRAARPGWASARSQAHGARDAGPSPSNGRRPADDNEAEAPGAPIDATALIRGMFHQHTGENAPGLGMLPPSWLDLPLLHSALRRVMSRDDASQRYGDPAGDQSLRDSLSRRLVDLGIAVPPARIVTSVGATHALDIIARTVLSHGDAVLVDEPGWAVEYARLSRMGMRLLPVPRGPDGPDLAVMETLAREHRPKAYVTVSVLHNPTGVTLTPAAAHRVLQLAERHDLIVVEDDTYSHLAGPQATRLSALDGLRRTVYVSGFSKILSPGWRVGYLAAPAALVDRLVDTKLLMALTSPALFERAIAWCIDQGALRRHTERIVAQLEAARARSQRLALEAGCSFATPPQGLFGWVETGVDTERLSQVLLDDGWLIAPGRLFHVDGRPTTLMRINFATSQEARFWNALASARRSL